jgi:hypothetical protein
MCNLVRLMTHSTHRVLLEAPGEPVEPSGTQHPAKSRRTCIRKIFVLVRERSAGHHLYSCRSSSPHVTRRKPANSRSEPYQRPIGQVQQGERRRQCRVDPPETGPTRNEYRDREGRGPGRHPNRDLGLPPPPPAGLASSLQPWRCREKISTSTPTRGTAVDDAWR